MPHFNMRVASDPESSYQVRSKGKTLKALMGDNVPYFGDHVELSDGSNDFASTAGVGGVNGTGFVLPRRVPKYGKSDLTSECEKPRTSIRTRCFHAETLGDLYDIGFDRPSLTQSVKTDKCTTLFTNFIVMGPWAYAVSRAATIALWPM